MGTHRQLSIKKRRLIEALMTERTVKAAAGVAGVAVSTAHRWLADADFSEALADVQKEALTAAIRRLTVGTTDAAELLAGVIVDNGQKMTFRLRAANSLLTQLPVLANYSSLEERVARLEEMLGDKA